MSDSLKDENVAETNAEANAETKGEAKAETEAESEAIDVTALLQGLSSGEVRGRGLTHLERRACVRQLVADGFTSDQMVTLLGVSERTITRDRKEVNQELAVQPDRRLGDELLGEYQSLVRSSIGRLTRLSRDSEEPAYARMWAEEAILRSYYRFMEMARKLNYLQSGEERLQAAAAAEVEAEMAAMSPEERLAAAANGKGGMGGMEGMVPLLRMLLYGNSEGKGEEMAAAYGAAERIPRPNAPHFSPLR